MFYLYDNKTGVKVSTKGKVIIFNTPDEAIAFKEGFIQYSLERMMQEDPFGIQEVLMTTETMQIMQWTVDSGIKDEDTVKFEILKK